MRISFKPSIFVKPPIDPIIKRQLDELGLRPTGSREGDLKAIKEAQGKNKPDCEGEIMPPPKTPPEIAAFMLSIGVQPTDSAESDMMAVTNRLEQLSAQAASPDDLDKVKRLQATWEQLTSSIAPPQANSSNSMPTDLFAGQNQLAKINKKFFVH